MCTVGKKKAYKHIWVVVKHHGTVAPQWVPGSEFMPREAPFVQSFCGLAQSPVGMAL